MTLQENVVPEEWADLRKYEVGRRLRFTGYNPDEVKVVQADMFQPGDILVVEPRNGCGMGIDVRRDADGAVDMIWPEEVEVEVEVEVGE